MSILVLLTFPFGLFGQINEPISTRSVQYLNIVIHLLEHPDQTTISDEQVIAQINALNKDFSKQNDNLDSTPDPFLALSANMDIQFCLPVIDPDGNTSTGITRTQTNISEIGLTEFFYDDLNGGKTAWDNTQYINVWVADMGNTGILGISTFPGEAMPLAKDGILINQRFFGVDGDHQEEPHNLGKVLTHEMGHYFGLQHIWGTLSTACNDDDEIADTPLQNEPTFGCPAFPNPDICTQGNGIMFTNFMDYSDDVCLTMFTQGQKSKVLSTLNNERSSLKNNPAEQCIIHTNPFNFKTFQIYPNPAIDLITIDLGIENSNAQIIIYNQFGHQVFWAKATKDKTPIDISQFTKGIYFVQVNGQTKKLFIY